MALNSSNWLIELRDDILERGSLYPGSDPIPELNYSNWLLLLRDDILKRGTLYPNGGDVGTLLPNTWLMLLRDDVVERGSLYPNSDAPDPVLSGLTLQGLQFQPSFSPDIFDYATGTTITTSTSLTETHDPQFTVSIYFNNSRYNSGATVNFIEGLNTFRVEVGNINGLKNVYTVNIAYTPPSTFLSNFSATNVVLYSQFDPAVAGYTATASEDDSIATFDTESPSATCAARLNGSNIAVSGIGPFTSNLVFDSGSNVFEIDVSNGTAPKHTYTFTITR